MQEGGAVADLSGSPSVRSMIWMLRDSVSSRAHCDVEGACEVEQGGRESETSRVT
jgi:hypothetical protein